MKKNILFTCVGRRVEILEIFGKEFPGFGIFAADANPNAPALRFADKTFQLPRKIDIDYVTAVLEICKTNDIKIVIPLIDTELLVFASCKNAFAALGILLMISSKETVNICRDKFLTYQTFFQEQHFRLPNTSLLETFCGASDNDKVILKPKGGSSSSGIYIVQSKDVHNFSGMLGLDKKQYIVQELIDFDFEVTVDIFAHETYGVVESCQRKRLKVRGGEVEQAVTIHDQQIRKSIDHIFKKVPFFGIINIQFMVKGSDYYLTEINPRIGGGFPLAYAAGANLLEHLGNAFHQVDIRRQDQARYKIDFFMARFDRGVYFA